MKKIVILIVVLFLTGCGSKSITCTIDINNSSMNYDFQAEYKIYYKGKYVTKIVKSEEYTTENKSTYKYLNEYMKLEYSMLSNYGGYNYKIDTDKKSIKIKTTIDAKKLDVEKMINDNIIDKYYTYKDRIYLSGLKKHYESKSAVCK